MSNPAAASAETLLLRQITGTSQGQSGLPPVLTEAQLVREAGRLGELGERDLVEATTAVLNAILDHINAVELGAEDRSFVDSCEQARQRLLAELPGGHLATGLVAFICLNAELLRRRFEPPDKLDQDRSDAYCRSLFEEGSVRRAIYLLYAPDRPGRAGGPDPSRAAVREWHRLDSDSFRYFRAGTTSVILLAREATEADGSGHRGERVVKCVLFPWNKIPAVATATNEYTRTYGADRTPAVVVPPMASTDRWVIMPRQPGVTLHEQLLSLAQKADWALPATRIRFARRLSKSLVAALRQLAGPAEDPQHYPAIQHLDLSPNNIMVAPDGDMALIDLGVNHLYSRQIGISEHDDSVYVAPEVKNRGRSPTADVYSLGIILIHILAGEVARDGRVPSTVYEMSPVLGRALDDLIDEDPGRRLLLLPADQAFSYEALHSFLDDAFAAVEGEPVARGSAGARMYARFAPASRELGAQFDKWRARHRAGDSYASYLLFFSFIATAVWWLTFARTGLPWVADLIDSLPQAPEAPTVAAVVALGQGLVGAKFYQTVLARLTTRHVPGALAMATEVVMRSMSIVVLPTLIIAVSWRPSLWAWCVAGGAAAVALNNLLTLMMAKKLFAAGRANQLSTVPPPEHELSRGFEQWWWTMLLYAVGLGVLAWGLQTAWIDDVHAYVLALVLVNVGIHYLSKCSMAGPAIRGDLARAFVVGERLARFRERTGVELAEWPPRLRVPARRGATRLREAVAEGTVVATTGAEP
jgi:hypothetical protein